MLYLISHCVIYIGHEPTWALCLVSRSELIGLILTQPGCWAISQLDCSTIGANLLFTFKVIRCTCLHARWAFGSQRSACLSPSRQQPFVASVLRITCVWRHQGSEKKSPAWILLSWALLARKWEDLHHSDKEGWIICSHSRFPKQSEARADQVKADSEEQPECEADVDGDEEGEEEEENAQTHPRGGDLASHLKQDGIAKQLIKKQILPPPPTYWPSSSLPRQASWTFPSTCSCSPFHSRSLFLLTL